MRGLTRNSHPAAEPPHDVNRSARIDGSAHRAHSQQNQLHTVALLIGVGSLLAIPVGLIWGIPGLVVTAVIVALAYIGACQTPPEMVMRAYRAELVTEQSGSGAQLVRIISALTDRSDLPARPALYVIPSLTLNAFATGTPDRAAVAITEGLLRKLNLKEVAAVLAHEVSHVKNNDLRVMAIADISSRLVQGMSYLAVFLAVTNLVTMLIDGEPKISWLAIAALYLSPLLSSLLQLGLSRTREYDADVDAAQMIGNADWLTSALLKLERHTGSAWEDLMMPVPGRRVPQPSLLRTHPTTEDRVERLAELKPANNLPPILIREEPFVSMIGVSASAMRPRYRFPGIWF